MDSHWTTYASHVGTFLAGALTGGLGKYLGDRFTDRRHKREIEEQKKESFEQVKKQMPHLIEKMQKNLVEDQLVREFFIISKNWRLDTGSPCFIYYYEDHDNLDAKVCILENRGYVRDITPSNAKKFRMTEEFAKQLLSNGR